MRVRFALVLTAALVLLSGLVGAGAAGASSAAGPDMTGAPSAGTCYDLTLKQLDALAVPRGPVRCATAHTAMVYAVSTLPADLTWESDADEIDGAMSSRCWTGFRRLYGASALHYARSQYGVAFYGPSAAQQRDGARWFSCLVVAFAAHGLARLPARPPHLSAHLPDSVATCATRGLLNTVCAQRHAWRVTWSFYARGKLTEKAVDRAAARTCPKHVTSATWLRSSMDVPGKRFVVTCYSRTRR